MVRVYGVPGCGPCEVAQMYLRHKAVPFEFVDLRQGEEALQALRARLDSPHSGVILEDGETLELMQAVSVPALNRWYQGYLERRA